MAINNTLQECIKRAADSLLSRQQPNGHWVGEMEGDTILESEYVLLMHILENTDGDQLRKAAEFIRQKQLPNGGWAIYPGGPIDLNASVKAYFALKLTGTSPDDAHMKRAKEIILNMGGANRCNSYTRFYLAALGQIDWNDAPAVPPEIMLLPKWFYFNLYEISSWSRTFVVPLSIIWVNKPVVKIPSVTAISELFTDGPITDSECGLFTWKKFFLSVDKLLKYAESKRLTPWREKSLQEAHKWMLDRFENSSGLGAIYPPMVYALIALRCLNYSDDHPQVVRARDELEALKIEEETTIRFQPCKSPVWDTAIAVNSLAHVDSLKNSSELARAVEWLVSKEVKQPGDWSVKRPNVEPGGWYFEYANEFYPDIDDTAMVLLALKGTGADSTIAKDAVRRAINWLFAMQGKDGGWASFDVDNNRKLFCSIPFADHNAMIDPSTADITGRIIEMLAIYGYDQSHPRVKKAIKYLLKEQEPDGAWFGRWGVNYIYGTFQVLKGLAMIGLSPEHPSIKRGVEWLLGCQNEDGGWGESLQTYDHPSERGKGVSTASQTAWAIIGLISSGHGDCEAVQRGVDFLIRTQNQEGYWDEDQWTGTGFPRVFYLKYHLYGQSFPLWALGMYAELMENQSNETKNIESGRAVS